MGTGVYKWPMVLAAEITARELSKSRFKDSYMCILDEESGLIYQRALDCFIGEE